MGVLRRSREYLDSATSLTLYKSLVLPHLDYCDLVYMNTTVQNLNKLQLSQNGACRTILRQPKDTSVSQMHEELGIPTLIQRREYHLATECYKAVNNPDAGLNHMFKLVQNTHTRTTRLSLNQGMTIPPLANRMSMLVAPHILNYVGMLSLTHISTDTDTLAGLTYPTIAF